MNRTQESPTGSSALAQRLRSAAEVLLSEVPDPVANAAEDASLNLGLLASSIHDDPAPDRLWLLLTAVSGTFPTPEEFARARRELELRDPLEIAVWLLSVPYRVGETTGTAAHGINIVRDRVLVDVQFTARNDLHTGIQRVVRQLVPRWQSKPQFMPVAWTPTFGAYQHLTQAELARVSNWESLVDIDIPTETTETDLVVPWRSVVVLPEVPPPAANRRLAALAEFSGSQLTVIGYDCIPVVSADLMPDGESERFVHYLATIKHAARIAAISESSAAEFRGFASMLATQGLAAPVVSACELPVEIAGPAESLLTSTAEPASASAAESPTVLSVGTFEPRKNQLGLLYAAEVLWREGRDFQLVLIGGSGWGREFPDKVKRLRARGRPITVRSRVTDAQLQAEYQRAHFTVFASLHEGYGLPVAESLAARTPVVATEYGSTGRIGRDGGALLIDPRDDQQLVDAMRTLLTDEAVRSNLIAEIDMRPKRSWADYAQELWQLLADDALLTEEPADNAVGDAADGPGLVPTSANARKSSS
ncbi:glycosyltransferase [Jatrophihabitans sp. DSM 45814]